jgi:hypothetical protein
VTTTNSQNTGNGANPPAPRPQSTVAADESVGELVRDASTHLSTLIRSEIELAKTELIGTVKRAGISIALFVVAGAIILYALTFGFISYGAGLESTGLAASYSFAIVFGTLFLLAGVLAFVGFRFIKRLGKPERTLTTVKDTAAWAKHPTKPN